MQRRTFIKTSCGMCMLTAAGIAGIAGCSPAAYPVFKTTAISNKIQVPLSLFDKGALQIIRTSELYYDVAVQKNEDGGYNAMLLQCTHHDNALTPVGSGYHCNLHGSEFNRQGKVTKGPAEQPLKQYQTSIDKNFLVIHF